MMVTTRIHLAEMPPDKWDGNQFVHATGDYVYFEDGTGTTEYEGDDYIDSLDCVEETEELE